MPHLYKYIDFLDILCYNARVGINMGKGKLTACVAAVMIMFTLSGCTSASSYPDTLPTISPLAKTYDVVPQVAGAWDVEVDKDGKASCIEGYEPFDVPFEREVRFYDYRVIAERDTENGEVTVTFLDGAPLFSSGYVNGSTPFDLDTYSVYGKVQFVFADKNFDEGNNGGTITAITFCNDTSPLGESAGM